MTTAPITAAQQQSGILPRVSRLLLRRATMVSWISLPAVLFMALVFLVPLILIVNISVTDPGVENYSAAWGDKIFRRSLTTTLTMAGVTTLVCLAVSYPYAYALARGGKHLKVVLIGALMLSFWTSTLVRTYAWQILLNNTGLINEGLLGLGIIDEPIQLIRTQFAVYLTMAQILAPFTILTIYAAIRAINPDLERAAQVMGARPSVAFWRVVVPLSLPGALAGGILVFVMGLGFYITPEIVGPSDRLYMGSAIVLQLNQLLNTGVAAAESILLLVVVLLVLALASKLVGIGRILGLEKGQQ